MKTRKKLSFFIIVLFFILTGDFWTQIREIEIILDVENLASSERKVIDPLSMYFLDALFQRFYPVLITGAVWDDFAQRRKRFFEQSKKEWSLESRIQEAYNLYLKEMNDHVKKETGKNFFSPSSSLKNILENLKKDLSFQGDFEIDLTCFLLPFKPNEWEVYEHDLKGIKFLLFIPLDYKRRFTNEFVGEIPALKDVKTGRMLAKEEIILGLKMDPKKQKKFKDIYDLGAFQKEPRKIDETRGKNISSKDIFNFMHGIFIAKADMQGVSEEETYKYQARFLSSWNIRLEGHGRAPIDKDMEDINALEIKIKECEYNINKIISQKVQDKFPNIGQLEKNIKEYQEKIEELLHESKARIATLTMEQFRGLLSFFQNGIDTTLLIYASCEGGGKALKLPFETRSISDRYTFTIICCVLGDMPLVSYFPGQSLLELADLDKCLHFSRCSVFYDSRKNPTVFKSKAYILRLFRSLRKYMEKEEKDRKDIIEFWESIANYGCARSRIWSNFPLVRLPGSTFFDVTPALLTRTREKSKPGPIKLIFGEKGEVIGEKQAIICKRIPGREDYTLTRIAVSAAKAEDKKVISFDHGRFFLYTRNIPLEINIEVEKGKYDNKGYRPEATRLSFRGPYFISMVPGPVTHYIQKINAPHLWYEQLIDGFMLGGFYGEFMIKGEKVYIIDEAILELDHPDSTYKRRLRQFSSAIKDVIIFNAAQNPFRDLHKEMPERISGIIYIRADGLHKGKSYIWLKPFREASFKNEIKRELNEEEIKIYKQYFDKRKSEAAKEKLIPLEKIKEILKRRLKKQSEKSKREVKRNG